MKDDKESDENIAGGQTENKEIITLSGGIFLKTSDIFFYLKRLSAQFKRASKDGNARFTMVSTMNYVSILKLFSVLFCILHCHLCT